ncbi:MAG: TonB-dependent receptor [Prolixibacteraceae bacterium]
MKKNEWGVPWNRGMSKLFLIMHLTVIFTLLLIFSVQAGTYSQETKLNISLSDGTIFDILQDIENKSEFIFIYKNGTIDRSIKRTIDIENGTIDKILELVFEGTDVRYKIEDRQILLYNDKTPGIVPQTINAAIKTDQPKKKKISGVVKDKDGSALPGVSVVIKGTIIGSVTNIDGGFTLEIPDGTKTIVFSFVGMKPQEVSIGNQTFFNIVLQEETVGLEEVIVVGYGIQKKESVVGAITQVDNVALMRSGNSNVTNAIAGKLSGVLTLQQSGEPGNNDSEIIIRGLSSWNGSQPLVLVDGVERDFSDLDPNEISTLSVLKDASATAVFGAKGANGVIIVTTKRGRLGDPKLDVSVSFGAQKATRIPDHIDSYTTLSMLNVALMNGQQFTELIPEDVLSEYHNPSSPLNAVRYPNVNWFDELTHPYAPTVNANFNITGGTNFIKYFCSLGYVYEGSFFDAAKDGDYDLNYRYNRFNYRANVDFSLTKTTLLSFNMGGETGIKNNPNSSPWRNLYTTSPARFPAYFPDWVLREVPDLDYPGDTGDRLAESFGEFTGNPYNSLHTGQFNEDTDSKLFSDLILDQKLDFMTKGLSFKGKVSLSTYFSNRSLTATINYPQYRLDFEKIGTGENPWVRSGQGNEVYAPPTLDINVGGLNSNFYRDLYYEFALNYARTFGNHHVTGLALFNRQQKNKGTEFAYYNEGLVGRLTYDFSHKYLMEINMGYTGSERFAPGNRYGFFPSGAFGWVISEEKFFKNALPWIDKLKIRYSDGLVGSDYASSRWLYISEFSTDNLSLIHEDKVANNVAQWEEARKQDIGLEAAFLKEKLTVSVDLFEEHREKMLLEPRSVTMLIGNSFKDLNLGSLKKHGIEVELGYNTSNAKQFSYWVKGIFGYNENRIIFKDDPPYTPIYNQQAGKPLGSQMSGVQLTGTGYFTSVDDIHNNAAPIELSKLNIGDYKFLDYDADGIISSLDKYPIKGSNYPPFTFSFSGGFTYKKFDFNFLFQGNLGKYVEYNQTYEVEFIKGDWRVHSSHLDYWTPGNQNVNHSTLHYSSSSNANLAWGGGEADSGYAIMVEDRFWRKADYLRLKEIYAGYTLKPTALGRWVGVSSMLIYMTGNNLWTLTNLIEGDPERKDFEQGFYPQMSSVKLGLKFTF